MRNPYVTGPYVVGRKHYGRQGLVDYLLHGTTPAYWVVGTQRVGKTSLLRHLAWTAPKDHFLPVWWDMQGCDTFRQLGAVFVDAVNDCGEQLQEIGFGAASALDDDVLTLLPRLVRAARKASREVLLLCDETEALIRLAGSAPRSLQRLHALLTAGNGLRVVAASTQAIYQLHDLCRNWPTSSFLGGFDMSQTLGSLEPQEARRLILQAQEPEPVRATPEVIEAVAERTNNQPYLIQLLCARLFQESGSLRAPGPDDLQIDPALRGFLEAEFQLLTPVDRQLLLEVSRARSVEESALGEAVHMGGAELRQHVHNLERLGHLRRARGGRLQLGNQFLSAWLAAEPEPASLMESPSQVSDVAMKAALAGQQAHEEHFLNSELNAHRARLVELEAVRARDLLTVSPHVLTEIEQRQFHIQSLRRLLAK